MKLKFIQYLSLYPSIYLSLYLSSEALGNHLNLIPGSGFFYLKCISCLKTKKGLQTIAKGWDTFGKKCMFILYIYHTLCIGRITQSVSLKKHGRYLTYAPVLSVRHDADNQHVTLKTEMRIICGTWKTRDNQRLNTLSSLKY